MYLTKSGSLFLSIVKSFDDEHEPKFEPKPWRETYVWKLLCTSNFLSYKMSFDKIHNLADEYFHHHVGNKRSFTHHVGRTENNFFQVNLFLYYNDGDDVDFEKELGHLNCLRKEWSLKKWENFSIFQKTKAKSWEDYDKVKIFPLIFLDG